MCKRKYPINEKCFDELNDRSAYFLGLLYADGSCTIENKIRLTMSDKDILLQYRDFLKTNDRPIGSRFIEGKQYFNLDFRSWRVHNKVKVYELTKRKECRHRLHVALLQPEIRRHFIRGIFDGDGCFTYDKRGYMFVEITGFLPLLLDIKNILVLEGIVNDGKKIVKNGSIFRIRLCASETINFAQYIYKDAKDYIRRKYNSYKSHAERLKISGRFNTLSDSLPEEGDLRPVSNWNNGKQQEFKERKILKTFNNS